MRRRTAAAFAALLSLSVAGQAHAALITARAQTQVSVTQGPNSDFVNDAPADVVVDGTFAANNASGLIGASSANASTEANLITGVMRGQVAVSADSDITQGRSERNTASTLVSIEEGFLAEGIGTVTAIMDLDGFGALNDDTPASFIQASADLGFAGGDSDSFQFNLAERDSFIINQRLEAVIPVNGLVESVVSFILRLNIVGSDGDSFADFSNTAFINLIASPNVTLTTNTPNAFSQAMGGNPSEVPLPGAASFMALGAISLWLRRRRHKA